MNNVVLKHAEMNGQREREGREKRERSEKWDNQRKTTSEIMCSRAPSAFATWPEVSSTKTFAVCPSVCASVKEREQGRGKETGKGWAREMERDGKPLLAGVDLCSNHTHDLLLHFGLLGVDVGISYLAIFIPARTQIHFKNIYIYIFFIKGHHCDFYLNVPPSAIPAHYNDFQGRKPPIVCVVLYSAHINSSEQKKNKNKNTIQNRSPGLNLTRCHLKLNSQPRKWQWI